MGTLLGAVNYSGVQQDDVSILGEIASCLWQGTTKSPRGIHPQPQFLCTGCIELAGKVT